MAQRLANYTCNVTLKGKSADSIQRVYEAMAPRSRNKVNTRTGKPFTEFSELKGPKKFDDGFIGEFDVTRAAIRGNHPNDVKEMARNAASKLNVDVDCEIDNNERKTIDEPENVEEEKTTEATEEAK